VLGLGLIVLTLLLAVGWTGFSVWVEDRYPSSDPKRALLPAAQRLVTKPVVNALSRQMERYVRRRAEAVYMSTGLTLEETIARFLDEGVALSQRRNYAYRLARVGSPECVAALLKVFQTASPEDKAFMAELIGSTGNPAAKEWLWPLLEDKDERVVKAGIRGLCAIGGEDVTARVAAILGDNRYRDLIRVEAALGLSTIGTPEARDYLLETLQQKPSLDVTTQILNGLGQFEFPTVAATFEQYLAAPETPHAMRVVAVEALAGSSAESVEFLLGVAGSDANTDVRASAAWAISTHDTVKDLGPTLATLAEREPAADVRRRLYEALLPQAEIPADRLLPMVQQERDIAARVAGFNALGHATGQQPSSAVALTFDRDIVPELVRIATQPNSLNIQMRAVFALRRAQTTEAQAALAAIATTARPQIATAARNGLRASGG